MILSGAIVTGTQTQVNAILAAIQQTQVQAALDPQTWIETVKAAARGGAPNTTTHLLCASAWQWAGGTWDPGQGWRCRVSCG